MTPLTTAWVNNEKRKKNQFYNTVYFIFYIIIIGNLYNKMENT